MSKNKPVYSVLFQVAGLYTHGKHIGKTNPANTVNIRLFAEEYSNGVRETVRDICNRLSRDTGGAFYRILEVENVAPETPSDFDMAEEAVSLRLRP